MNALRPTRANPAISVSIAALILWLSAVFGSPLLAQVFDTQPLGLFSTMRITGLLVASVIWGIAVWFIYQQRKPKSFGEAIALSVLVAMVPLALVIGRIGTADIQAFSQSAAAFVGGFVASLVVFTLTRDQFNT
jgi:uncharacterized membrane protein YvlD (DUF360 family)